MRLRCFCFSWACVPRGTRVLEFVTSAAGVSCAPLPRRLGEEGEGEGGEVDDTGRLGPHTRRRWGRRRAAARSRRCVALRRRPSGLVAFREEINGEMGVIKCVLFFS